uniref:Putative stoned b synaptic vesicle bioproteinsis protein n=1 Tax=Corethrella appendiculata TaxID=1370023 RepID=W4VRV0_9DIPT
MANPFLMDDDVFGASEPPSNPFLFSDAQEDEDVQNDNPFLAQTATNPFAFGDEDGEDEEAPVTAADIFGTTTTTTAVPHVATTAADIFGITENINTVAPTQAYMNHQQPMQPQQQPNNMMNFFDMTITDDDEMVVNKPTELHLTQSNNVFGLDDGTTYSSEEELRQHKPQKPPPPRPIPPPSQATQLLIHSIADQLDQTSNSLLRKIPATRTPSPVNMRDLNSPSPTPDQQTGDLFDISDGMDPSKGQEIPYPINPEDGLNGANLVNDNPFASDIPKVERAPPRPRPPPPRPAPPKSSLTSSPSTASTPAFPTQTVTTTSAPVQDQEPDLFDMFGTTPKAAPPKPPAPKSKQDILSLFSQPAAPPVVQQQQQQPDLLCGDIMDMEFDDSQIMGSGFIPPPMSNNIPPAVVPATEPEKLIPMEIPVIEPVTEPSPEHIVTEPDPTIYIEEPSHKSEHSSDHSPTGSNVTSGGIPSSVTGSILNVAISEQIDQQSEPDFEPEIPEQHIDEEMKSAEMEQHFYQQQEEQQQLMEEPQITYNQPVEQSNPFDFGDSSGVVAPVQDTYIAAQQPIDNYGAEIFSTAPPPVHTTIAPDILGNFPPSIARREPDAFDAFSAKFEGVRSKSTNIFLEETTTASSNAFGDSSGDAWGDGDVGGGMNEFAETNDDGFGNEEGFDSFLSMQAPPAPEGTPYERRHSRDSDDGKEFNVVIRPKDGIDTSFVAPSLAPPPKSPQTASLYSGDSSPRINPFDRGFGEEAETVSAAIPNHSAQMQRTDSQETPPTPLFDEDVSQPLEDFPRITYTGSGWEMHLRQPNKKKITGQRFWKKIHIRLVYQGDIPTLLLYNSEKDKDAFQELPLQASYSVSEISAQQFDNFGKIFTIKVQYIFYKERPGVRPGQVTKAERITNKLSQFAAYAIQGDYQGVKELGSDLKKLGLPVEHAPQTSQLLKLGSMTYEDMKQFSMCIEEALFKMNAHRDRALTYKMEEVQVTAVDELYVEQDAEGHVLKQIARVRLFFLAFLSGMPDIELGVNDLWRQGKEVVGRHDIIPVVTEEWIRLEGVEFHGCVQQDQYERCRTIKFKPPDASYIELMRFRVRPPKNRELPLQLKAVWHVIGNRVELRADVLVPGFASRKLGQIPCEDVSIRFPIPECWIYLFRVEKHFRYGSVKSAHRRTGKIKGIERILGTMETLQESLIEVTSGQAKYEHHHRAIVWRCPRLPKEGQGAYTTHQLVCRMALTSYDQIPDQLSPYAYVEFSMPATQVSHTTVRSVSVQESDSDEPPEKYVRYLARHEYRVGIEHTTQQQENAYLAATAIQKPAAIKEEPMATTPVAPSDSDSDSN